VELGGKPYTDKIISENRVIRTFNETVSQEECEWHRDREDRVIRVLEGKGWKLQKDNELPFTLESNSVITIKKEQYHRLITGDTPLVVEITKHFK